MLESDLDDILGVIRQLQHRAERLMVENAELRAAIKAARERLQLLGNPDGLRVVGFSEEVRPDG